MPTPACKALLSAVKKYTKADDCIDSVFTINANILES